MSRQYAIRDRDGTIHDEPSRSQALREQKAYGGMVVKRNEGQAWEPYKPHRVFLWVFLTIQVTSLRQHHSAPHNDLPVAARTVRSHSHRPCIRRPGAARRRRRQQWPRSAQRLRRELLTPLPPIAATPAALPLPRVRVKVVRAVWAANRLPTICADG